MKSRAIMEIELLSETIFGGDAGAAGAADIEVQTDEYGLPFLAGRTLKGLLREQAEWYNRFLPKDERLDQEIERLFGKPGEDNHHGLRFGNAKLADAIYEWIKRNNIGSGEALDAMTTLRSMTSIDETGKAEKGTLRQARVVKPGYVFYAPIFVNTELSKKEKELLEKSVKLVRHIGLMRNRGKGEVRCSLKWLEEVKLSDESVSSDKYYELTIFIHEPLKISQVLGTSDSSQVLHYIPGHVLRGALVQAYLQSTGKRPEELETEEVFNPHKIQFWNGYLALNGKRGLPFVQHLFEAKEESKKAKNPRYIYPALDREQFSNIRDQSPVRISRDVMAFDNDRLLASKVKTTSALHLSLLEDARRLGKNEIRTHVYRYEALAPGQVFKAVVYAPGQTAFVQWLASQKKRTLWLGGARNSGYGRVSVVIEPRGQSPEQVGLPLKSGRALYVLATSDWIIRDQNGLLCSSLDSKWLGEQLGVELELEDQVVNTQWTGGFISQWQAYQPAYAAIQAGSIYKYRVLSGLLDPQKMERLMEKGVGARVNEGFGRLILFTEWPFNWMEDLEAAENETELGHIRRGDPSLDDLQIERITKQLAEMRYLEETRERVTGWVRAYEESQKKRWKENHSVNNSQWGKLWNVSMEILINVQTGKYSADKAPERWEKFWDDVKSRTENKQDPGLLNVRIGKLTLQKFIFDQLEYRYRLDDWLAAKVEDQSLYWNLRALELFFRQIIRIRSSSVKKVAEQ